MRIVHVSVPCERREKFVTAGGLCLSTRRCTEANRLYLFVRIETGDELSRRAKFAFITWIGERVSPLKKAKMSTDKAMVKEIVQVRFVAVYIEL